MTNSDVFSVKPSKISSEDYNIIKNLQDVIKILLKYDFKTLKLTELEQLATELNAYKKFPFMKKMNDIIETIRKEHRKNLNQKQNFSENYNKFKLQFKDLINNVSNKNVDSIRNLSQKMLPLVNDILTSYEQAENIVSRNIRNPFYFENMLIFGDPNAILKEFNYNDMENFANLDLVKFRYSYLKFPDPLKLDWLLYYVKKLKSSPETVELTKGEFLRYQKFLYSDNEDFNTLIKMVEDSMYSNNKENLETILSLLKKFPDLYKQNEVSKNTIEYVFRGIPDSEKNVKDILKEDLKKNCISTSTSRHSAQNFALQIGHLESEESRRNEVGYLVTYHVDYNSIILDLNIFGSIFNEFEVLIDPKKSTVYDVEIV